MNLLLKRYLLVYIMKEIKKGRIVKTSKYALLILFILLTALRVSWSEEEVPDWVKRVEFSGQWETDQKPTVYFQTVQPLYQDDLKENTIFVQPRVSYQNEHYTFNMGVGYRRLVSENLIFGINVFGDFEEEHDHGRTGVGIEALGQVLEFRFNSYIGVTEQREIAQHPASNSTTLERVANGIDYELGAPVPYLNWLKIYGSGFYYDFNNFNDRKGWKTRLEANLNENLRLEFFTWDDNKGDQEYGGRLRFDVSFGTLSDIFGAFKFSEDPYPKRDLKEDLLIPVEREHNIVVEGFVRSTGLIVEAGRQ